MTPAIKSGASQVILDFPAERYANGVSATSLGEAAPTITLKLTLKALWDGSFTFSISTIISDMEKAFAKKLGFLLYKENQVLNF
ncbi:MAG: hypothetical protein ACYTXY_03890 [Nostoc sp.]